MTKVYGLVFENHIGINVFAKRRNILIQSKFIVIIIRIKCSNLFSPGSLNCGVSSAPAEIHGLPEAWMPWGSILPPSGE